MKDFLRRMFAKQYSGKISYKQYQSAIEAHQAWKLRMIRVIQGNENLAHLDPAGLACASSCSLGQWLQGDDTAHLREHPDFVKLICVHERFHQAAAKTLRLAMEHRGREVMFQLSRYGEFEKTSLELTRCLYHLHHDEVKPA